MNMPDQTPEVVVPNLKKRFSGITSTMVQVLPEQQRRIRISLVGRPLEGSSLSPIAWRTLIRASAKASTQTGPIIFHARRNDDMIVGLILKHILRRNLHLVFTSVAQRPHTRFTRFLYQRMDTLLSTSHRSASYLTRKPDAIIPHGTDIETFHPAEDRDAAWVEGGLAGRYGIGIFGRVRPQKGVGEFVEAMIDVLPRHPEYTAVIIGQTTPKHQPFVDSLKRRIAERGLTDRFVWLGKLPFEEISLWFRRMSLVVAASRNEGFGLTCLEAMASGSPVVATPTGGFEMVIREDIDGRIVPCSDSASLARAVDELLSDRSQLERMGRAARERIEDAFTVEREARELVKVYRTIQATYKKA